MDSGASDKTMVQKTFKLVFSETDIRRISINSSSWDSFITQLQKQYPTEFHPELRIQYVDNEGDRCTLSSKQEWDSMMDLFGDQPTIKLYISEGVHAGRYFKDGPPPEVHYLYLKTGPGPDSKLVKINREDESSSIAITVPQCLKRLFPSGQILPYNLPSWLQPHVKVTKVPGSETDVYMDIDISSLFDELHRQALKRIGPNKKPKALERAKAFLESMLAIVPKHPVALYNLACAEALLGRGEAAINALKEAVAAGYSNVTHMISDADLASLHRHVEFNSLVEQMKAGFEKTKAGLENGLEKTKAGFENGLEMTKAGFEKTRASVTAYAASLREQQQQQQPAEQPVEEVKKEEEEVQLEPVPDSESESEPYVVIEKQQPQEEEKKVEQPVEVKQPEPVVVEEKKVEQPVEEPAPRRIKPEFVAPEGFKWPEQLRVMVDMGFDASLSMQKLQKRKGNLDRAVNDMLLS